MFTLTNLELDTGEFCHGQSKEQPYVSSVLSALHKKAGETAYPLGAQGPLQE